MNLSEAQKSEAKAKDAEIKALTLKANVAETKIATEQSEAKTAQTKIKAVKESAGLKLNIAQSAAKAKDKGFKQRYRVVAQPTWHENLAVFKLRILAISHHHDGACGYYWRWLA